MRKLTKKLIPFYNQGLSVDINKHFFFLLAFLLLIFLYLYNLGNNPTGFFCDEALYGFRSFQLLNGDFSSFFSPFFNEHFGYIQGNLIAYAPLPFILLFGLSEFSIRLTSVVYSLLFLLITYVTLRQIGLKKPTIVIIFLGLTPFYVHISRIYFGMTPAIFLIGLGYFLYVRARSTNSQLLGLISGFVFGGAIYGYPAFSISILLLVFCLIITELLYSRNKLSKYKITGTTMLAVLLCYLPLFYSATQNPIFFKRLEDKNIQSRNITTERILNMLNNYPKYYSFDYLFNQGESGLPGALVQRHSVNNAGILLKSSIILIILAFIFVLTTKDKNKRFFLPFFFLMFLYPIPDLITTTNQSLPYSFPLSSTIIFLPFIVGYTFKILENPKHFHHYKITPKILRLLTLSLSTAILLEGLHFFFITYQKYPLHSSDYWGWQYGPKPIMEYFVQQNDSYDQLCLERKFNAPRIFIKFYDPDNVCKGKCQICGLESYDPNKKQLFAITKETYEEMLKVKGCALNNTPLNFNNIETIYYPNGKEAFIIGRVQQSTKNF